MSAACPWRSRATSRRWVLRGQRAGAAVRATKSSGQCTERPRQMITARCTLTCSLQEVTQQLMTDFNCYPVFLGAELKNNYYKSEAACRCTACSVAAPHVPCLLLWTELRFCRRLPLLAGCVSSLLWACKCGLWPAIRTLQAAMLHVILATLHDTLLAAVCFHLRCSQLCRVSQAAAGGRHALPSAACGPMVPLPPPSTLAQSFASSSCGPSCITWCR